MFLNAFQLIAVSAIKIVVSYLFKMDGQHNSFQLNFSPGNVKQQSATLISEDLGVQLIGTLVMNDIATPDIATHVCMRSSSLYAFVLLIIVHHVREIFSIAYFVIVHLSSSLVIELQYASYPRKHITKSKYVLSSAMA